MRKFIRNKFYTLNSFSVSMCLTEIMILSNALNLYNLRIRFGSEKTQTNTKNTI